MNKTCIAAVAAFLALGTGLRAQTIPLYINSAPVNVPPAIAPQIDATAFLNLSIFNINTFGAEVPYQMLNNLYFTNRGSGQISGYPGFRWDFYSNGTRRPMDTWLNQGSIQSGAGFFFFGGNPSAVANLDGPWLLAWANHLTNRGTLQADYSGLLQLRGSNVSIGRSIIATGNPNAGGFGAAPDDIRSIDQYWAVGTNNTVRRVGPGSINIDGPNFQLPFPFSPAHQVETVIGDTTYFTNFAVVAPFNADAWVWTNSLSDTSSVRHIVFAPAINRDPAIATEVEFFPDFGGPASAVVGVNFRFVDFDPINEVYFTNGVALQDALGFSSPVVSITNFPPTFKVPAQVPNVTGFGFLNSFFFFSPFLFIPGTGEPANATFDPTLIYNSDFLSNAVFMPYVAYSAEIPLIAATNNDIPNFFFNNPSNYPGRIEILSDNLNLDQARFRAESTVIIKSKNVASNRVARIDSPFLNLDLASTQPLMLISNFTQPSIRRLNGTVRYWSAIWTNYFVDNTAMPPTTNEAIFHVMMVDNDLQSVATPGINVNEFLVHSTNIVIADSIRLGQRVPTFIANESQRFLIEATNLTITGELILPGSWSWATTNVVGLINLTNRGNLFIPGAGMYGTDRPSPYANFVNSGTNLAASQLIRTLSFENAGQLEGVNGPVVVQALNACVQGIPPDTFDANVPPGLPPDFSSAGPRILSGGDVQILAGSLALSNAVIIGATEVDGVMSFFVTNSLTDGGPGAVSYIWNHGGVEMRLRPATSSLLGTHLTISAGIYEEFFNVWAGQDLGPVGAGYSNNLAVGQLTLNFGSNSLVFFSPVTDDNGLPGVNAMYVEYLELLDQAQDVANTLAIDQNFRIYFANANVDPVALTNANPQLVWIPGFAGALSSTNYVAANGKVYQMNAALARSMSVDSDGDGVVNGLDEKPFYTPDDAMLSVSLISETPKCAQLSWTAPANATNTIEYTTAPGSGTWTALTNFVQGALNAPAVVLDPLSPTGQLRVYRLRVNPRSN